MKRAELEHLLRAAAAICGERRFYVVGTAALVPVIDGHAVPDVLDRSREADLIPGSNDARSIDLIDGALGLDSIFDGTFGYHADGVELATVSQAPKGWEARCVHFATPATNGAVGMCMERHDLAIAKLCAGRDKDLEFVRGLVQAQLLEPATLGERLLLVAAPPAIIAAVQRHLAAMFPSPP